MQKKWFKPIRVNSQAKVNLVCFPFAGSGASIFFPWEKFLHSDFNIYAFQAPGREDRIGEDLIDNLELLVQKGSAELLKLANKPIILFGHSLGAVIAFEITKLIEKQGIEPKCLIVSGRQPPHLSLKMPPISELSDQDLLKGLLDLEGTDREIVKHPELLEIILPIIRADFKIGEKYLLPIQDQINCPIIAIGANNDPWVKVDELSQWQKFTRQECQLKTISGDHFYVKNDFQEIVQLLNQLNT
jgi:surfactin synthase thioesterase subunit